MLKFIMKYKIITLNNTLKDIIPNICWAQIVKCDNLLLFSALYDCKLNTAGFRLFV